jgi:hypothetical protein
MYSQNQCGSGCATLILEIVDFCRASLKLGFVQSIPVLYTFFLTSIVDAVHSAHQVTYGYTHEHLSKTDLFCLVLFIATKHMYLQYCGTI